MLIQNLAQILEQHENNPNFPADTYMSYENIL